MLNMKTAEEMAREISYKHICGDVRYLPHHNEENLMQNIAQALTIYAEECVKESHTTEWLRDQHLEDVIKKARAEGRKEGLEEAANKWLEKCEESYKKGFVTGLEEAARTAEVHNVGDCPEICRCEKIAKEIRSRKDKP